MNPQTIQNLRKSPEFKELVAFLAVELAKLNSLDNFPPSPPDSLAIEVVGRLRAYKTLSAILAPLLDDQVINKVDPKEFVV